MLARYAWATLWVNIGVILFGAYVRATGSGAGCGASWPTCNGEIIPSALDGARAIEFTHRATSGIALIMVAVLVWWIWRSYPAGHRARRGAAYSGVFIIGEALIGAMIVLYEWVADDASAARTAAVPLHLVNTLLLLAALTLTAWWVSGGGPIEMKRDREFGRWWLVGGVGVGMIAATGAITALADTLFPSESVIEGLREDFTSAEHFLTNLRVAHPIVAVAVGVYLIWLARRFGMSGPGRKTARAILALVAVQMLAGALNIALLTPVWMQLVHLLLADLLWVSLVWFGAQTLADRDSRLAGASQLMADD
jgi:heme A synthase